MMAASVTFAVVMTASVAFAVIVIMVVTCYVRVVNQFTLEIFFYLFICITAASASENDALLEKSVLCTGADTAADEELNAFALEKDCE